MLDIAITKVDRCVITKTIIQTTLVGFEHAVGRRICGIYVRTDSTYASIIYLDIYASELNKLTLANLDKKFTREKSSCIFRFSDPNIIFTKYEKIVKIFSKFN